MAATINLPALRSLINPRSLGRAGLIVLLAGAIWYLGRVGLWGVAALLVVGFELWPRRRVSQSSRLTAAVVGVSTALIVGFLPKAVAQISVAALYGSWRLYFEQISSSQTPTLGNLLVVEAVAFEAIFLGAAVEGWPTPVVLVLAWAAAFGPVYVILRARHERGATSLAAAWALVAAELTWVFMTWLVSYISPGNYVIIPQPALILTTLAYCFGSIYAAQRQGKLNRGRLTEYLLIAVILLAVVIAGTPWRGTV